MTSLDQLAELAELALRGLEKRGAGDAQAHAYLADARQVKFANNTLALASRWSTASLHLFASFGGRIVTTTVRQADSARVEEAVGTLEKMSKGLAPNEEFKGLSRGPFAKGAEPHYDPTLEEPGERPVELVERAVEAALREGAQRVAGVLELSTGEEFLATSAGFRGRSRGSGAYLSVRALVDGETSGAQALCARTLDRLPVEEAARRAGELASLAKTKAALGPGTYDTVWEPLPLAALLNRAGDSASVFSVEAGFSFLQDKLGKRVASEAVSLSDDATLPEGFLSTPFDEEGTATRPTPILERGVLKTYLHNASTALRHGTTTTGHAGLIAPHPWNLVLAPGSASRDELLREVKRGLLVTNVWYTRFQNYLTGDFSTIPRDGLFLVEDGEVVGAVRGLRVTDNLQRFLEGVALVGRDAQNIKSWEAETPTVTPAALVRGVRITASTR
jgi:PmbA protein